MQPYSNLIIVLPCHSLEDFPIHHRGEVAADLLAHWTALWHPALIASCGQQPRWHQADKPNVDFSPLDSEQENDDRDSQINLVLIPEVSQSAMDSELVGNLMKQNAQVISGNSSRAAIVNLAIEANEAAKSLAEKVDPEIAQDFYALGYGFLQVQIMTRQLRYSSNLDEKYFADAVMKAAEYATLGDQEKTKAALVRCFDLLLDEKNSYYPVDPELIDVVLTAPTTLGASLTRQLEVQHPINILMTGVVCEKLAGDYPDNLELLKQRISDERATVIGGLQNELPEPLVSSESTVNQLHLGRETFKRFLNIEPRVFMRRRFGLHSSLPGLLDQFNFVGAVHATLDGGKFPNSSNSNIRWTGDDERSLLAIGDLPLSATDSGSFLGLGVRLGEAIDSAHLASAVFVHWPGDTCESYNDVIRISNYGSLFGVFIGLEDYFDSVYDPGYGDTFTADEYKTPFLKQDVESNQLNPISRHTTYWQRYYQLASCRSLLTHACGRVQATEVMVNGLRARINDLQTRIESGLETDVDGSGIDREIDLIKTALHDSIGMGQSPSGSQRKFELINSSSTKRRVEFSAATNHLGSIKNQLPVVLAHAAKSGSHWMVEVPAMGSTGIHVDVPFKTDVLKSDPSVGEGNVLRNEFFELQVDDNTGGIRSIQLYSKRINLASQQLAIRVPGKLDGKKQPLTKARYTQMVADEVKLEIESRLSAKITSTGKLMDGKTVAAEFQQTVRVLRGQPNIEVAIDVKNLIPLTNSINHYLCSRLAWKSESARVVANTSESRHEVNTDWFHATNFMEIVQDDHRLTMFTGGLPYHRRVSRRMVDSVLLVGNEQSRQFKFGLGVDVSYPLAHAVTWMTPPVKLETSDEAGNSDCQNTSSWLFHFDCKNILATWWDPFFDDQSRWAGVHLRLRESEGRKGKLAIRCPRKIMSGEQLNFAGDFIKSLDVAADEPNKLEIEFGRFDYFQVSIRWKI